MGILTGAGKKFMEELPLGIHILSEGAPSDVIKLALYGPSALLSPEQDSYSTDGEVAGGGYVAGGVILTNGLIIVGRAGSSRVGGPQFDNPYIQPVDDTEVNVVGVGVRGCLMYNSSRADRTMFTLDFGTTVSPKIGIVIQWGIASVIDFEDTLIPIVGNQF